MNLKNPIGIACILVVSLLAWPCSPTSARTYQYIDRNGVVHFTDSLSKIPDDHLPVTQPTVGEENDAGPEGSQEAAGQGGAGPGEEEAPVKETEKEDAAEGVREIPLMEDLNKEKANLDTDHARLAKQRKALTKERDTLKTVEQVKEHQKRVNELNKQIDAYDKRNRAYQEKVDAYNKAVKGEEEK
jgi:hypothetical protein